MPTNWSDFFDCWKDYYQGSLSKKPDFARAWEALPKYICWKLWKTRNSEIFEGKKSGSGKVVSTEKALWVEALSIRKMDNINKEPLTWATGGVGLSSPRKDKRKPFFLG